MSISNSGNSMSPPVDRSVRNMLLLSSMIRVIYPGLTWARCIRFLQFEFNHVFVFNSTIFKYSFRTFSLKMHICRQKKKKTKKAKDMFNRSNCDRKS